MQLDILDFSRKLISKCIPVEVNLLHATSLSEDITLTQNTEFSTMINYHLIECLKAYFKQCTTNTITTIITPFHTQYFILCLSRDEDKHLAIGPFVETPLEESFLYTMINDLHLNLNHASKLRFYAQSLPSIDPAVVLEILYTINEYITQSNITPPIQRLDLSVAPKKDSSYELFIEDMNRNMLYTTLEKRYAEEDKMLSYITKGEVILAQSCWKYSFLALQPIARFKDSIRNTKNFLFVANTLFRKAAQAGGVHPVYINELSEKWALKIESAQSFDTLDKMPLQMIRSYCLLTKNRSLIQYSPVIRKALHFIHLNLSSHLTVKKIAEKVGLSPDYLTRLFKKELNTTVIDYINKKRIYTSLKLLSTTSLSIAEIGDLIGINNTSYFHTLFKKEIGISPALYRSQLKSQ